MQAPLNFEDLPLSTSPLRAAVLGSGSGGNAVVVESNGFRVLIDAGFSCKELERRMRLAGIDPASIGAVLLTHEHEDHIKGVDRFARKHRLPVYLTAGTMLGTVLGEEVVPRTVRIESGRPFEVGPFAVEAFSIPHDAREPVGFVLQDSAGRRLGLAGDIGCRTQLAWGRLADLDCLLIETNHDLEMLRSGPYPWALKQRVAGRHGHLSNREAADGLPELLAARLRFVVLYHLSRTNNLPALAAAEVAETLAREGSAAEIVISSQFEPSSWLEVGT
ncbi:MAG: MBL fold metallo-hydrolase [Thermoanaerobaculia bacterium]|nr:MBL fold metallo-hydrolase [Thermoanaerobaculia bacterium]